MTDARFSMESIMQLYQKRQHPTSNLQRRSNDSITEHRHGAELGTCRLGLILSLMLGAWCFSSAAATNSGLWVGEVSLGKVNETVGGINAANQLVFNDPAVPTPVASAAHLRVIFHVDSQGQVRLLKNVAILAKTTN